jgi:hypothetical protein
METVPSLMKILIGLVGLLKDASFLCLDSPCFSQETCQLADRIRHHIYEKLDFVR